MYNYVSFYFQSHHIRAIVLKASHYNGTKHLQVCANMLSLEAPC